MAELLIMTHNHTHADPIKERRGSWKRGMVMDIHEDGWKWSETELTSYKLVKMPGVLVGTIYEKYMSPQIEDPLAAVKVPYRRREYTIDLTQLTKQVETALANAVTPATTRVAALSAIAVKAPAPTTSIGDGD